MAHRFGKVITYACLLVSFVLLAEGAWSGEPYKVAPVKNPGDMKLLPASAWPPPESASGEMVVKLFYLRGILDALQYAELAPNTASRLLEKLKGKTLAQLAAELDRYYLVDPRRRELPPAAVLIRVLPEQKPMVKPSPMPRQ